MGSYSSTPKSSRDSALRGEVNKDLISVNLYDTPMQAIQNRIVRAPSATFKMLINEQALAESEKMLCTQHNLIEFLSKIDA